MTVSQNLVPLVNIKIAGKWMFIPLKMVLIGIDPYPYDWSQAQWSLVQSIPHCSPLLSSTGGARDRNYQGADGESATVHCFGWKISWKMEGKSFGKSEDPKLFWCAMFLIFWLPWFWLHQNAMAKPRMLTRVSPFISPWCSPWAQKRSSDIGASRAPFARRHGVRMLGTDWKGDRRGSGWGVEPRSLWRCFFSFRLVD